MSVTRRAQAVLVVLLGALIAVTWNGVARAQTTTAPTTNTTNTTNAATSTTRAVTSTSRAPTTTTTRRLNRLTFTASPTVAAPGSKITVASVNPCTHTGSLYVLLSLGQFRLGSGAPDSSGHWRFTVVVPQVNVGTYGLSATCLVSRNGVDENAGIYVGPEFTVTQGSGPPPPTTPEVHESSNNTPLVIGLIVAVVIAIAAIAYAISLRRKHRKELAAASRGPGAGAAPGGPQPPDTFA